MSLRARYPAGVHAALAGSGVLLQVPPVSVRVRSPVKGFARAFADLYRDYPVSDPADYADIDIRIVPGARLRRLVRPTVQFVVDGARAVFMHG